LVATNETELDRLDALEKRAAENDVAVERLDGSELKAHEPNIAGLGALRVPVTGIVDYAKITRALLSDVEDAGGEIVTRAQVRRIERTGNTFRLHAGDKLIEAAQILGCAGLHSDRLASMAGLTPEVRIVPFRGEYFTLPSSHGDIVRHLIYPVPDPAMPFLGVHLTPRVDGTISIGPNAVLSLAREKYGKLAFDLRDAADALLYPGTWRLIARHPAATSNELLSWLSRKRYLSAARKYCPALKVEDLTGYHSGNRAQAVRADGTLVDDFLIAKAPGLAIVLNAPSPAATSAIPIANEICNQISI
jgi:L-2-hydroxyglutarate oxidase